MCKNLWPVVNKASVSVKVISSRILHKLYSRIFLLREILRIVNLNARHTFLNDYKSMVPHDPLFSKYYIPEKNNFTLSVTWTAPFEDLSLYMNRDCLLEIYTTKTFCEMQKI